MAARIAASILAAQAGIHGQDARRDAAAQVSLLGSTTTNTAANVNAPSLVAGGASSNGNTYDGNFPAFFKLALAYGNPDTRCVGLGYPTYTMQPNPIAGSPDVLTINATMTTCEDGKAMFFYFKDTYDPASGYSSAQLYTPVDVNGKVDNYCFAMVEGAEITADGSVALRKCTGPVGGDFSSQPSAAQLFKYSSHSWRFQSVAYPDFCLRRGKSIHYFKLRQCSDLSRRMMWFAYGIPFIDNPEPLLAASNTPTRDIEGSDDDGF